MYHYVYRITNKAINKHYYGVRTSKTHPKDDLGYKYFSSSTDKEFIKEQKSNPDIFKYKVVMICETRDEVLDIEVKLHNRFNVAVNESFYNKAKQNNVKFDRSGVPLTEEHKQKIKANNQKGSTGYTTVIDSNGIRKQVKTDDIRYIRGELKHFNKGYMKVIENGKCITIKKTDFDNNKHTTIFKGLISVKDTSGNMLRVTKEEFDTGMYTAISKGLVNVIDLKTGKETRVTKEEYDKGGYVSAKTQKFEIYDNKGVLQHTIMSNFTKYCEKNGLPYGQFIKSYRNGGVPIYENITKKTLTQCERNGYVKYIGWYCKKVK